MLETLKEVVLDFLIVGLPCFIIGSVTTLTLLMNEKYKADDKHEEVRDKRIKYIYKLEGIVVKKRREEQKIDIDVD